MCTYFFPVRHRPPIFLRIKMQSDSVYLLVYFGAAEDDRITYCQSNEDAIVVHPVDATWQCKPVSRRTTVCVSVLPCPRVSVGLNLVACNSTAILFHMLLGQMVNTKHPRHFKAFPSVRRFKHQQDRVNVYSRFTSSRRAPKRPTGMRTNTCDLRCVRSI